MRFEALIEPVFSMSIFIPPSIPSREVNGANAPWERWSIASEMVPDIYCAWALPLFLTILDNGLNCLLCLIDIILVSTFLSCWWSETEVISFTSAEPAVTIFLNFEPYMLGCILVICDSETRLSIIAIFRSPSPIYKVPLPSFFKSFIVSRSINRVGVSSWAIES